MYIYSFVSVWWKNRRFFVASSLYHPDVNAATPHETKMPVQHAESNDGLQIDSFEILNEAASGPTHPLLAVSKSHEQSDIASSNETDNDDGAVANDRPLEID